MKKFTLFFSLLLCSIIAMAQPSTMLTAEQLNAATTTQKIAIKNVSSDNYRWFVATSNIEALSHNVVFDWIPNTDGSFYLKLTYGDENSYIQQGAVNDKISFGTIDNAAKLKAVEPSTANGTNGYTALNYNFTLAQGADDTKFVRFVLSDNSVWFNCQATNNNPVYKNAGATGGWTIHNAYDMSNYHVATLKLEKDATTTTSTLYLAKGENIVAPEYVGYSHNYTTQVMGDSDVEITIQYTPMITDIAAGKVYSITNKVHADLITEENGNIVSRNAVADNLAQQWYLESFCDGYRVRNLSTGNYMYATGQSKTWTGKKYNGSLLYVQSVGVANGPYKTLNVSKNDGGNATHWSWSNVVGWYVGADASHWYFEEIDAPENLETLLSTWNAEAEKLEAKENLANMVTIVGEKIGVLTESMLSSNARTEAWWGGADGNFSDLIDNENNTHFGTNWGGAINTNHYLQIDLAPELEFNEFSIEWINRNRDTGDYNAIKKGSITASADGKNWTRLDTLTIDNLNIDKGATNKFGPYNTTNDAGSQYRYIRITCTESDYNIDNNGKDYTMAFAEIDLVIEKYTEQGELFKQNYDAAKEALNSTSATTESYKQALKTFNEATLTKPTYPFELTTDDNDPKLYVLKSGRGNFYYTLVDNGVKLADFTCSDTQYWYFKEIMTNDYQYALQIIPYNGGGKVIGYYDTTAAADKLFIVDPASTDFHYSWVLDQSFGDKLGFKPYKNQSTYLSNFGGTGNKMGFYSGNPNADSGTCTYVIPAEEENKAELKLHIDNAKGLYVEGLGKYKDEKLGNTILVAEALYASEGITIAQTVEAINNLATAIDNADINKPTTGYYRFKCHDGGRYLTSELTKKDSEDRNKMDTSAGGNATSILYYSGENVVFYNSGNYLNQRTPSMNALTVTFPRANNKALGYYNIEVHPQSGNHHWIYGASDYLDSGSGNNQSVIGERNGYNWSIETVTSLPVTVSKIGWATLYTPVALTIPADIEAYYISDFEGAVATLKKIEKTIPSNTAVILKATNELTESTQFDFVITNDVEAITDNKLEGTVAKETKYTDAYILSAGSKNEIGLYPLSSNTGTATGGSFINGSHKAYLPVSNAPVAGSNGFSFRFEDGMTTGIDNVNRESDNVETIYDLTGRRLEAITAPGIYIVNGNKVLVK